MQGAEMLNPGDIGEYHGPQQQPPVSFGLSFALKIDFSAEFRTKTVKDKKKKDKSSLEIAHNTNRLGTIRLHSISQACQTGPSHPITLTSLSSVRKSDVFVLKVMLKLILTSFFPMPLDRQCNQEYKAEHSAAERLEAPCHQASLGKQEENPDSSKIWLKTWMHINPSVSWWWPAVYRTGGWWDERSGS